MGGAPARLTPAAAGGDARLFLGLAAAMAAVTVAGFLNLWLQGVTSFAAPWPVHLHGIVFMGWVGLFVAQVWLGVHGPGALHCRLGRLALLYIPLLLVVGTATIVRVMRLGTTPPMWTPPYVLVMNMMALAAFALFTSAALLLRHDTAWHRRLMVCGMAALVITPVNRLMPVPVLFAVMGAASAAAILLFPLAGMWADRRRTGRTHPAWLWGLATLAATGLATEWLGRSPLAAAAVAALAQASPSPILSPARESAALTPPAAAAGPKGRSA